MTSASGRAAHSLAQHQPGDGEAGRLGLGEQLGAGSEGIRLPGAVVGRGVAADLLLIADEAAADREIGPLGDLHAVGVEGAEGQRVGMLRGPLGHRPEDIARLVEDDDRLAAAERKGLLGADPAQASPRRRPGSRVAGSKPARPRITARSVAWPRPVSAREPYRTVSTRAVRVSAAAPARRPTNRPAAIIGPMVCELDGPTPCLKRSKTLTVMRPRASSSAAGGPYLGRSLAPIRNSSTARAH